MRSYSRQVFSPGDPGGAANASPWGRPARLAMFALSACLSGVAVPGSPVHVLGLGSKPAVAQSSVYRSTSPVTPARHDEDWRAAPPVAPRPVLVRPRKPAPRLLPPPPRPWLPTGTGMWIHEWPKTQHGNARQVVNRARAHGI